MATFSAIPARLFQRGKLAGRQRQWVRRDAGGQGGRSAQDYRQSASVPIGEGVDPPYCTVHAAAEKRRIGVYGAVRAQQQQLCGFDAPTRPKRFE